MDEKQKKTGITAGLVLLSLGLLFAATAQSGGSDGYELSVDTLPPEEVQSTEANFTANVTGLADEYDAALVYWNYSKDSSLDKKGPANIAFQEGEKVESLQPDLDPDANYNVEAYVEPIVWEDEKLFDNLFDSDRSANALNASGLAMTTAIGSQTAMNILYSQKTAMKSFWNPNLGNDGINNVEFSETGEGYIKLNQSYYEDGSTEYTFVNTSQKINVTGYSDLVIDWKSSYSRSGGSGDRDGAIVYLDGDQLVKHQGHRRKNETLDITGYSGSVELRIEVEAYGVNPLNEYGTDVEATIYDLYLK